METFKDRAGTWTADDLRDMAIQVADHYQVPKDMFLGLLAHESAGWKVDARNPNSSATGLGQFIDGTAKTYFQGLGEISPKGEDPNDPRYHPGYSMDASARYLSDLYKERGSWQGALKGYYGSKNPDENERYVEKIVGSAKKEAEWHEYRGVQDNASAQVGLPLGNLPREPSKFLAGVSPEGLESSTSMALHNMAQEYYERFGEPLHLASAFRSKERQAELRAQYDADVAAGKNPLPVAQPNTSMHPQGRAVDVSRQQVANLMEPGPDGQSLLEKHGFHQPVPREPFHLQLVPRDTTADSLTPTVNAEDKFSYKVTRDSVTGTAKGTVDRWQEYIGTDIPAAVRMESANTYHLAGNVFLMLEKLANASGYDLASEEGGSAVKDIVKYFRGLEESVRGIPEPPLATLKDDRLQPSPAKDWLKWAENPAPEFLPGWNHAVIRGMAGAPQQLANLLLFTRALKSPVAGFASHGFLMTIDQGYLPAIEAAVKGAVTGLGFKGMEPLKRAQQFTGLALLGGTMAALEGGTGDDIIAGALVTAALGQLGASGNKTARQMLQDAMPKFLEKYRTAKDVLEVYNTQDRPLTMAIPGEKENSVAPSIFGDKKEPMSQVKPGEIVNERVLETPSVSQKGPSDLSFTTVAPTHDGGKVFLEFTNKPSELKPEVTEFNREYIGGLLNKNSGEAELSHAIEGFKKRGIDVRLVSPGDFTNVDYAQIFLYMSQHGKFEGAGTVLIGHGLGTNKSWRFQGTGESVYETVNRLLPKGEKAFVMSCEEGIDRNIAIGEGKVVTSKGPGPSGETEPTLMHSGGPGVNLFLGSLKERAKKVLQGGTDKAVNFASWVEAKTIWSGDKVHQGFVNFIEARDQRTLIRQVMGEKWWGAQEQTKLMDQAIKWYIDTKRDPEAVKKYLDKVSPETQALVAMFPVIESNPALLEVARRLEARQTELGRKAMEHGVIDGLTDNYMLRAIDNRAMKAKADAKKKPGETKPVERGPVMPDQERHQARVYKTMLEGEAKGQVYLPHGATEAQRIYGDELVRLLADRKMQETLPHYFSTHRYSGWDLVDHQNFTEKVRVGTTNPGELNILALELNRAMTQKESGAKVPGTKKTAEGNLYSQHLEDALTTSLEHSRKLTAGEIKSFMESIKSEENVQPVLDEMKMRMEGAQPLDPESVPVAPKKEAIRHMSTDDVGTIWEQKPMYAPKEIAQELNDSWQKGKLAEHPVGGTLLAYNAMAKAVNLSFSLFHPQAFLRSVMADPLDFWAFLRPMKYYKEGKALFTGKTLDPDLSDLLKHGNLTAFVGDAPDWIEVHKDDRTFFGEVAHGNKWLQKPAAWFWRGVDANVELTFTRMGNAFKAKFATNALKWAMERTGPGQPYEGMDRMEILKQVGEHTNNVFGGLNDTMMNTVGDNWRMAAKPIAMDMQRLILLARDWTLSNLRLFTKAMGTGEHNITADLSRRYFMHAFGKTMAITTAINLVMTMGDDKNQWERWVSLYEQGKYANMLDLDYTPLYRAAKSFLGMTIDPRERKYFSALGHFADHIKMMMEPKFIPDKMSVLARIAKDAATGRDWRGNVFTTMSEMMGTTGDPEQDPLKMHTTRLPKPGDHASLSMAQTIPFALHAVTSVLPIGMQNYLSFQGGEVDAWDAVMRFGGVKVKTGREKSAAEIVLSDAMKYETPVGTPLDQLKAEGRNKIMDIIILEKNPDKFDDEIVRAREAGEITEAQFDNMYKRAEIIMDNPKYGQFIWRFMHLNKLGSALRVFEASTLGEKDAIAPVLDEKFTNASPEDQEKYQAAYEKAMGAVQ